MARVLNADVSDEVGIDEARQGFKIVSKPIINAHRVLPKY